MRRSTAALIGILTTVVLGVSFARPALVAAADEKDVSVKAPIQTTCEADVVTKLGGGDVVVGIITIKQDGMLSFCTPEGRTLSEQGHMFSRTLSTLRG